MRPIAIQATGILISMTLMAGCSSGKVEKSVAQPVGRARVGCTDSQPVAPKAAGPSRTYLALQNIIQTMRLADNHDERFGEMAVQLGRDKAETELLTMIKDRNYAHKLHAVWLRELYSEMGVPARGEDTQRAIDALNTIRANCDELIAMNPEGVVESALKVAIRVEEREALRIYPQFRDQALAEGNQRAADVYQRVIDSESEHAGWFHAALSDFQASSHAAAN